MCIGGLLDKKMEQHPSKPLEPIYFQPNSSKRDTYGHVAMFQTGPAADPA